MTCGGALDIDSRHRRAADFQRNTLNTFFDMVGAMGLDDPDRLCHINFAAENLGGRDP